MYKKEELDYVTNRDQNSVPSLFEEKYIVTKGDKETNAIMTRFPTGYMVSKEDTVSDNVRSSFDASMAEMLNYENTEGEATGRLQEEEYTNSRLEKSEHTEFSINQTQNLTGLQHTEESKRRMTTESRTKILDEVKGQPFVSEKDYALVEKFLKRSESNLVLRKDEQEVIRELLLYIGELYSDNCGDPENSRLSPAKKGKPSALNPFCPTGDSTDALVKSQKKIVDLERQIDSLQNELNKTQERLISEIENRAHSDYCLDLQKEKEKNIQLIGRIATLEKSHELLHKKLKNYEDSSKPSRPEEISHRTIDLSSNEPSARSTISSKQIPPKVKKEFKKK